MDNLNNIIESVLKELELGVVRTDINYRIKIHSKFNSHFEITPTLNIKDKDNFYNIIREYVLMFENTFKHFEDKESYIKRIIVGIFANMSLDDFNSPDIYVKRLINFKKNPLLEDKSIGYIQSLDSSVVTQIVPSAYETPFYFRTSLEDNGYSYFLPDISYGISDGICYIYAIQNHKSQEITPYSNKIKRKLYKINAQALENETEEYKDYKNNKTDYYPENISDVSPAAVLALTIFLNAIETSGISKVQVVPYLPARYENKVKVLAYKAIKEAKDKDLLEGQKREYYMSLIRKQNSIQSNITEKFIRTSIRVAYHFSNVLIKSYPMELDSNLHLELSRFEHCDNAILDEVVKHNNKTL